MKKANVGILGFTFKENCQDTRNTKVFAIVRELQSYGIDPIIADSVADVAEAKRLYDVDIISLETLLSNYKLDALIVAVAHDEL